MALIDANQGHESVNADLGETIYIRVGENPTTGYRWFLEHVDNQMFELEGSEFQTAIDAAIGAAGLRTFVFKATGRGKGKIQLKLWREWEGSKSVIDRRDVLVTVL